MHYASIGNLEGNKTVSVTKHRLLLRVFHHASMTASMGGPQFGWQLLHLQLPLSPHRTHHQTDEINKGDDETTYLIILHTLNRDRDIHVCCMSATLHFERDGQVLYCSLAAPPCMNLPTSTSRPNQPGSQLQAVGPLRCCQERTKKPS